MKSYAFLPLLFVKFWFFESPRALIGFFLSLNRAFFQLFSLPLLLKTFFKPLKNEYRSGLIKFSRVMGVIIKLPIIIVDVFLLALLLISEALILVGFLAFPLVTVLLLFW